MLIINTDEHFLTFGDLKSNEINSINIQIFLHVLFIRHAGTTVTQVTVISGLGVYLSVCNIILSTLVPRATLRGVAELHVASGMPQWRMFVTFCYF